MNNTGYLFIVGVVAGSNDVDTIELSLINPVTMEVAGLTKTILKSNGDAVAGIGGSVIIGNPYYIRIKHRNSVETWSNVPVVITPSSTYLFTASQSSAFGDNLTETFDHMGWAIFSGDINHDGAVDALDYVELDPSIQAGDGGYSIGDLNGDGAVDALDYLIMDPNIQNGVGTISPP